MLPHLVVGGGLLSHMRVAARQHQPDWDCDPIHNWEASNECSPPPKLELMSESSRVQMMGRWLFEIVSAPAKPLNIF